MENHVKSMAAETSRPFSIYAGHKNLATIRAQCQAQGITLNTARYDEHGDDFVVLTSIAPDGGEATVLYNVASGWFFGTTHEGVEFDSTSPQHEGKPWFDQLLAFFYIPEAPPQGEATGQQQVQNGK